MRHSCFYVSLKKLRHGFRTCRGGARLCRPKSTPMHRFEWHSGSGRCFEFTHGYPFQLRRSLLTHDCRLTSHSATLQSP
jgi:hypothetical protein